MKHLFKMWKKFLNFYKSALQVDTYKPVYRLIEILQDENENYVVYVQVINKNVAFHIKPEEILKDDKLVDQFSPRDVRTLTYLGYLGINSPKYKILAQRMVDDSKIIFIVKKKGQKDFIVKSAQEILNEQDIISNMPANDAKTIGYTVGINNFEKSICKSKLE